MAETNLEPEKGSTSYKVTDKSKARPAPLDVSAAQAMSISFDKTDKGKALTPKSKLGHRRVDEKGETTYKKTPSSALMSAIQLGIGFTVGRLSAKQESDVLMQDFAEIETVWFPSEGTKGTPSHKFSDFKFKSYAPVAYRFFRELFNMKPDDFMMSLCNDPLLELSNPGASGSLFYVTCDNQFIIKTVDHKEAEFLQKLLPGYYLALIIENLERSLFVLLSSGGLTFLVMYKLCGGKNIRLAVMNNLLPTVYKFHWKYDLKGSTYKRRASKAERAKNTPTLKDLDFLNDHPEGILLESDTLNALLKTLQRDCRVLESFKIMDYSLLLAIHNLDEAQRERQQDGTLTPSGQMTDQDKPLDTASIKLVERAEGEASSDLHALQRSKSMKNREGFNSAWEAITVKETIERPYGGIPARNAKGERLLLFIGIIDILQSYRLKKKLEHGWKSMIHDGDTVSVHRPSFYSRRFLEFMTSKVFKKLPGKEKTSPRKRSLGNALMRQRSMTEADKSRTERRERTLTGEISPHFKSFQTRTHRDKERPYSSDTIERHDSCPENSKEMSPIDSTSSETKEAVLTNKGSPDSGISAAVTTGTVSTTTNKTIDEQTTVNEQTVVSKQTTVTIDEQNTLTVDGKTTIIIDEQTMQPEEPVTNQDREKMSDLTQTELTETSQLNHNKSGHTLWDRPWSPGDVDPNVVNHNKMEAQPQES